MKTENVVIISRKKLTSTTEAKRAIANNIAICADIFFLEDVILQNKKLKLNLFVNLFKRNSFLKENLTVTRHKSNKYFPELSRYIRN